MGAGAAEAKMVGEEYRASAEGRAMLDSLLAVNAEAYRLAARILGREEGADDAVQDAYLRVIGSGAPEGMPASEARIWFMRVVANTAKNRAKMEARRKRREAAVRSEHSPSQAPAGDTVTAVRKAMEGLESEYRLPVSLSYEQGFDQRDAAAILEIPIRTFQRRVSEGLERLRAALAKAGYTMAPAAIVGGLAHTAPPVPAGLSAALQEMVSKGLAGKAVGAKAASGAEGAAKGGLTVKIVAGVVLAGALAGVGVAIFPGKPGVLPAEGAAPPPPAAAEQKGERVYDCEQLLRVNFANSEFVYAGPRTSAYNYKFEGLAVDNEGNVYGAVKGQVGRGGSEGGVAHECVIMKYDPRTERLTRLAGGARGMARDGPGEVAQFNYQFYGGGGMRIDNKRGYLYLSDTVNGVIRRISTKDGRVTTVAPDLKPSSICAVDQEGVVYVHVPWADKRGLYRLTPEGAPGAETYKVERVGEKGGGGFLVADAKRGKVYASGRGSDISTLEVWDLKAGGGVIKPVPIATPSVKVTNMVIQCGKSDGPLEGAVFYCPVNSNISPDGRYLYIGGGDEPTFRRIDVDGRRVSSLWKLPDGRYTWKERPEAQNLFAWPSACCETEDGTFYIGSSEKGMYRLKPVGRQ